MISAGVAILDLSSVQDESDGDLSCLTGMTDNPAVAYASAACSVFGSELDADEEVSLTSISCVCSASV